MIEQAPIAGVAAVEKGGSQGGTSDAEVAEHLTHAQWWDSNAAPHSGAPGAQPHAGSADYDDRQASQSLQRAVRLVWLFAVCGVVIAWALGGWRAALALIVGATISASGLREWRRLMVALTARMDASEKVLSGAEPGVRTAPSIAFAITGFTVRLLVVMVVLYGSLSYLHGSVAALAAGLLMGVAALTIEGIRLLRSGTI